MTGRGNASIVHIADIQLARHQGELGDFDTAIAQMDHFLDELFHSGSDAVAGSRHHGARRSAPEPQAAGDMEAARAAIDRLAAVPTEPGTRCTMSRCCVCEPWSRGPTGRGRYRRFTARYRAMAESCEFEGHRAIASSMA